MKKGLIKGKKGLAGFLLLITGVFLFQTSAFAETSNASVFSEDSDLARGDRSILFSFHYESMMFEKSGASEVGRALGSIPLVDESTGESTSNYVFCAPVPNGQAQQPNAASIKSPTPPADSFKILAELAAGIGAEIGCSLLGLSLADAFLSGQRNENIIGAIFGSFGIMAASYIVGTSIIVPLVVSAIGSAGKDKGDSWAAWLGSLLGFGVSVAIAAGMMEYEVNTAIYSFLLVPPIFSVIGYNLTRKYKPGREPKTALLNFRDGEWNFGVPAFQIIPASPGSRSLGASLSVASIEF